jgi:hypothetical protein
MRFVARTPWTPLAGDDEDEHRRRIAEFDEEEGSFSSSSSEEGGMPHRPQKSSIGCRAPRKVILSPAAAAAAVLAAEAGAVGGAAAGAAAGACAGAVRGAEEAKDDARKIEILTELLALEKKKDKELAALSLEQHRRDEQLLINEQVRRRAVERHTRFCVI